MTESHHGSISVSTLCWIIAGFLLDLCYVWVWWWECEAEQKLRVIFVFSFIETVLQLLWACILLQSVSGLVRCWPLGMFYWTLCGKLKPNNLLCRWMTVHLVEFTVSTERGDLGDISAMDDETLTWSTGDAVHSPSQLNLLGVMPH